MGKYDKDFSAFTRKFNGLTNVLTTKVSISLPFDPKVDLTKQPPQPIDCDAIWDTGASMSTITKDTAQKLGLQPSGKIPVNNTSGTQVRDTYVINVYLPNNVAISYVKVVECESLVGNFGFLVGMDVISLGDLSVTNVNNQSVMSFRIPSIEEIDYVKEVQIVKNNRKIFGKIEVQKEKRETNTSSQKIKERRAKEKSRRKAQKKNRGKKK